VFSTQGNLPVLQSEKANVPEPALVGKIPVNQRDISPHRAIEFEVQGGQYTPSQAPAEKAKPNLHI